MAFPESPAARMTSSEIPAAIHTMAEQTKSSEGKEQLKLLEEKAKKIFEQLARMQETGEKWENMTPLMKEMGQLFRQACDIRAREIGTTNSENEIENVFNGDSRDEKVLRDALMDIARKADIDPATISMSTPVAQRGFFIPSQDSKTREAGPLSIDIKARNDALTLIETHMRRNPTLTQPQYQALVRLKARLDQILRTNSVAALDDTVAKAINLQKTDYRPLRLLGAAGGTVLTAIGLGVFFRTGKLPWPTLLWGFVAAVSACPDLLKSPSFQKLKNYQFLADNQTQAFMREYNIQGAEGAKTVQIMFDQSAATKKNLQVLLKKGVIDESNLKAAGADDMLIAYMMRLPHSDARASFIRIFSTITDREVQIKTADYIKHRLDTVA